MLSAIVFLALLGSIVTENSNNGNMFKTFVVKLEDYARLNAEQALAIAEYSSTTAFLTNTVVTLNATIQQQKTSLEEKESLIEALNASLQQQQQTTNENKADISTLNKALGESAHCQHQFCHLFIQSQAVLFHFNSQEYFQFYWQNQSVSMLCWPPSAPWTSPSEKLSSSIWSCSTREMGN